MRPGIASHPASQMELDPFTARNELAHHHRSSARVDPVRVNGSWWVRALREESPAVQRVVAAAAPETVRSSVQAGLLLDNDDLRAERVPDPEVLAWVMSLWSERLVGGAPGKGR